MQLSQRTIQRMHERIGELASDVDRYLDDAVVGYMLVKRGTDQLDAS